jgi:hypothetical protein
VRWSEMLKRGMFFDGGRRRPQATGHGNPVPRPGDTRVETARRAVSDQPAAPVKQKPRRGRTRHANCTDWAGQDMGGLAFPSRILPGHPSFPSSVGLPPHRRP